MEEKKYSEEKNLEKYVKETEGSSENLVKDSVGAPIADTTPVHKPWLKTEDQISRGNMIGWQNLKIEDFPTRGLFYPIGTEVYIRAATAGEIRHWSTLNEEDLSLVDDMLNYVLERCVSIKFPGNTLASTWRDIKEVDRFYILLAVRELTFIKGENKLQVSISENKKVDVTKEMISYITFEEELMKRYNEEKRCFTLKFKSGKTILVDIPSVGVTNWLKNYINRKNQNQQGFDKDFISFAPFVIRDWRGLNDNTYINYVNESENWSIGEISALIKIKELFSETVDPVVKYVDEQGGERVAPLSFQGGIKSLFLVSDAFAELV